VKDLSQKRRKGEGRNCAALASNKSRVPIKKRKKVSQPLLRKSLEKRGVPFENQRRKKKRPIADLNKNFLLKTA